MELEPLELRDRRYRAQKALDQLKDESQAEERKALEAEIARYQEICPHEHAEDVEGEWRCKDCDLQKTTAAPEPEPEPEPEAAPAEEAAAPAEEAAAAPADDTTAPSEAGDTVAEKPAEDAG